MSVVIAIDAGTTGVRAFAVREDGSAGGYAYCEFPQHFPRPGWVEHDAADIWSAVLETLGDLAGRLEEPVAAIGITDQRETVVAWDRRTGDPVHRAIVWQDRRTAARCDALRDEGLEPLVRTTTGLVLDPYFSATKAEWLLGEGGVAVTPHLAIGTVDAWVLWNLTGGPDGGVFATEPSNASRTMLFDIGTLEWSEELLDRFGVPPRALPEVQPSSGRFGRTAAGMGVAAGIPVSGIAGDQQAALFGQACLEPGMTKNTYGTGSFVLMHVGDTVPRPGGWPAHHGRLDAGRRHPGLRPGGCHLRRRARRCSGCATASASSSGPRTSRRWRPAVPDTDGCFLVPAFTGLGSPWWDPYARGTIVGITRGTGRGHLARAVLESISLQTRDVVDAMSAASGHPIRALKADGGASANDLLLQLQADDLQVPVSRPVVQETTALGAAYLAGLAEGVWDSPADITANWRLDATFEPGAPAASVAARHAGWARAVERSRGWAG